VNPIDWLCKNSKEFQSLSEDERDAITDFTLLWSFFEAKEFDSHASSSRIYALVPEWQSKGMLNVASFAKSFGYFQNRYFNNSIASEYYRGLYLRENDKPELVEAVLKGENTNPADCIAALLIVIYRLRNNLFHGIKWNNAIHDQLDNFSHANTVLMVAMESLAKFRVSQ